jgi:hypothetical protein
MVSQLTVPQPEQPLPWKSQHLNSSTNMIIIGQYFISANFLRQVKYMLFPQFMLYSTVPVLNEQIYIIVTIQSE